MNVAKRLKLKSFLLHLADVFDGDIEIEKAARQELRKVSQANFSTKQSALPKPLRIRCIQNIASSNLMSNWLDLMAW